MKSFSVSNNYETTPELIDGALNNGATLMEGYLCDKEVAALAKLPEDPSRVRQVAPKLARLAGSISGCLRAEHVYYSHIDQPGLDSTSQIKMHRDSDLTRGFSLLVPVAGPKASFYFADERLEIPTTDSRVNKLDYGPSDVLLLRQAVTSARGDVNHEYEQVWHAGIGSQPRTIFICDILVSKPIEIKEVSYE